MTKIVVLTPIKNEEWILKQFLATTSLFADAIIIADQQSTDNSRLICSEFKKVHLIENRNENYDESSRQKLLINAARSLFPENKLVFFCLDADEIFSGDSLFLEKTWQRIKDLEKGTAIYLEKPDLLFGLGRCVRWRYNYFPIGYVDDGEQHQAQIVHSKRIPEHSNSSKVSIDDIKVLHFAHSRKNVQSAKLRYYSIIENINKTKPLYLRRFAYKCYYDETRNYPSENIEVLPDSWFEEWDRREINLRDFEDPQYSWHDFEILKIFKQYGVKKFFFENIWEVDWERIRKKAIELEMECPQQPIKKPSLLYFSLGAIIDKLYKTYRTIKQ